MMNILGVEMYTQREVCDMLGVTPQTIRNYVRAGKISPTIIGRKKCFSKEMLTNYLINGTAQKKNQKRK